MDLDTKKNLASNWFKTLQNALCESIIKLENSKTEFKATTWKRNKKKSSELSSTCMVYQILNFLLKLTPIYLHFLKVFPCCNKVLL